MIYWVLFASFSLILTPSYSFNKLFDCSIHLSNLSHFQLDILASVLSNVASRRPKGPSFVEIMFGKSAISLCHQSPLAIKSPSRICRPGWYQLPPTASVAFIHVVGYQIQYAAERRANRQRVREPKSTPIASLT